MNIADIEAGARHLQTPDPGLSIPQIDQYADYLVRFTQKLVEDTVPWSRPSSYAQPWWTLEVQKAVRDEREARRQKNWGQQKEAQGRKNRMIHWAKRKCFREMISEAIEGEGI